MADRDTVDWWTADAARWSLTDTCDWRVNVLKLAYQAYISKKVISSILTAGFRD